MMDIRELHYKGTQVAYYVVCKRKLWLFSKGVGFEHLSEKVAMGKLLDQESFKRENKEYFDENINIDFLKTREGVVVHEIKYSDALEDAHFMQVKYYIYYLRLKGVNVSHGVIHYPKSRRLKKVEFLQKDYEEINQIINMMDKVLSLKTPPPVEKKNYCKNCAYFEFCYI